MNACNSGRFGVNLGSAIVTSGANRRLTSFYMLVENRKDRWRRSLFNWRKCNRGAQAMSYILPEFCFADNPPFTQHHQLLTPTPRVALSRVCKCSVTNTSGRVCMVFRAKSGKYVYANGGAK